MATNVYIVDPVKVVVYDPIEKKPRHVFVFPGDVPKSVLAAMTGGHSAAVLRDFYGAGYKSKLGLDIFPQGGVRGGDESDDLTDIERLLTEGVKIDEPRAHTKLTYSNMWKAEFEPGVTFVQDIHVYPEDRLGELKAKIFAATGIPTYRQHIFYKVGAGADDGAGEITDLTTRVQTTYRVHVDGVYPIDIRTLADPTTQIHGVNVDKLMYDSRETVKIESFDSFRVLANALDRPTVYVVDLAQFTFPRRTQLIEIVNDRYQNDLFYYGFIMKYWPELTQECFADYVSNESELSHKYPYLAPQKSALSSTLQAERNLIDETYKNFAKYSALPIEIAITQVTTVVSGPPAVINIRNLFDNVRTTRCIPEIHAYVEHGTPPGRYLLRKRHVKMATDILFPSVVAMKAGLIMAISIRKADQESFHAKRSATTAEDEQARYIFLSIHPNGRYYVRTMWAEEEELDFEGVIRVVKKFVDPIIAAINKLGRNVFGSPAELPLLSKSNVSYQGLNISVKWKRVMQETMFRALKTSWEPYFRAEIAKPRPSQQYDKYELTFRKGMYEFDTSVIEKIMSASNNIVLNNHYAYLSNVTIKQKWDQSYAGRTVRMTHRTTDIRFEILDIREEEFQIFYRYIQGFIYRATKLPEPPARQTDEVKKLRKLREEDPELFNLKKHGSKKVYSIICQNQRQPLVYTDDELSRMSKQEVRSLVKYWNFTMEKPAYYGCPNKKYPHLGFIVGVHPRGYCLPCCNKKETTEDSKKSAAMEVCTTEHKFTEEDAQRVGDDSVSRHIMNYGKEIESGRLAKIPQSLSQLFAGSLGTVEPAGPSGRRKIVTPYDYYLYGVPQHVPGADYVGAIFALAAALELTIEGLVGELTRALERAPGAFATFLNGALFDHFTSARDLTDGMHEIFVKKVAIGERSKPFKQWSELIVEMSHIFLGVVTIPFIDETGHSPIDLFVSDVVKKELVYRAAHRKIAGDGKFVIIVKQKNLYYPMFVIRPDHYFRDGAVAARTFDAKNRAIETIFDMVGRSAGANMGDVERRIDLTFVEGMIAARGGYKLVRKYINRRNLCYAVLVELVEAAGARRQGVLQLEGAAEYVYVPIDYSTHVPDGTPISFETYNGAADHVAAQSVVQFINAANEHIKSAHSLKGTSLTAYSTLKATRWVVARDKHVGIMVNAGEVPLGVFWCEPDSKIELPDAPADILYDYSEVNKLIMNRAEPAMDKRAAKVGAALYNNYLYQLVVLEFVSFLESERNTAVRASIRDAIQETNFRTELTGFKKKMRGLLPPADYATLQAQLAAQYSSGLNKTALLAQVDSTSYEFDRLTLQKLRKLPLNESKVALRRVLEQLVLQRNGMDVMEGGEFPNIYAPCGDNSAASETAKYCIGSGAGRKLIINRPLDEFVDLLAVDLRDELKARYLLNNVWQDTLIDYFKFNVWPSEIISVYKLLDV